MPVPSDANIHSAADSLQPQLTTEVMEKYLF